MMKKLVFTLAILVMSVAGYAKTEKDLVVSASEKTIYITGIMKECETAIINQEGSIVRSYVLTSDGYTSIHVDDIEDGVYYLAIIKEEEMYSFEVTLSSLKE